MKNWIVGGLVFVLISCQQETRNEQTFLSVKDILEIGELITAEYHGEVIKSLRDVYIESDSVRFRKAYQRIKATYDTIRTMRKIPLFAFDEFKKTGLMESEEYVFLKKVSKRSWNVLFMEEEVHKNAWSEFYKTYKDEIDQKSIKKRKKIDLVYIARGSVNAGFDLTFLGSMVFPVRSSDTLYLRNMDPVILDAVINPWYSREKEIPGFEIIKSKNEDKITYDEITTLKREMKEELINQAITRDIFQLAIRSGENSLAGLLGRSGKEPINKVVIVPSKYFDLKNEIVFDHRVGEDELAQLDSLFEFTKPNKLDSAWFTSATQRDYYMRKFLDEIYVKTATNTNADEWDEWYRKRISQSELSQL